MKKIDNPTFMANDGTLFDNAGKAVKHDLYTTFEDVLNRAQSPILDSADAAAVARYLVANWEEIRLKLSVAYEELGMATGKWDEGSSATGS